MTARRAAVLKAAFVIACVAVVYFRLESGYCWYALAMITAIAAVWRGRWEERATAVVMTVATLGGVIIQLDLPGYTAAHRQAAIAIDSVETVLLVAIALRSRLWWPSWNAAFHLGAVANHLVFHLWPDRFELWAYLSGVLIWGWLGLLSFSLGTFDAWRLRRAQPPASTPVPAGATRR